MEKRTIVYRDMALVDYAGVLALMCRSPGVSLRDADSQAAIARFLERNPGLSAVAVCDGAVVGCLMAGHDGRRGYLHHLVVDAAVRRQGVGRTLVLRCLRALGKLGIHKIHVDVFRSNESGKAFWAAEGWLLRDDIDRFSIICGSGENA